MRIIHERAKCIGCGSCASLCGKFFEMAEEGKAHLKDSDLDLKTEIETLEVKKKDCIQEAARACPVKCIKIND